MSWCDNPRDHEREGASDYRRRGSFGYDREQYNNRYEDDCAAAYMRGFRDEERRAEQRRAAAEQAAYEYWEQCQQQDYEQPDDQQL